MSDHEQKNIPLKTISVDSDIIPLVNWLNSFDDIFTLYSCKGNDLNKPWITFFCNKQSTLYEAFHSLSFRFGEKAYELCVVISSKGDNLILYKLKIRDEETLKFMCERMQ